MLSQNHHVKKFLSLTLIYPHLSATKRPKHSCTYNIKLTAELQG